MIATKIPERIDEIDSSESTFNSIVWTKNNLIIPYINLGVSEHPLNEANKLKYINFSYIVCLNVSYLAGWSEPKRERVIILDGIRKEPIYYFGGTNLEDEASDLMTLESVVKTFIFRQLIILNWVPINGRRIQKKHLIFGLASLCRRILVN